MSLKTVAFAALVSVAAAGSVFAAGANPGKEQIAAKLGVDASQFTLSQLVQLEEAARDNDRQAFKFIQDQAAGKIHEASSTSPGNVQRALTLGVEPGRFTPAELTQLEVARKNGDSEVWRFITTGANRTAKGDSNNAGKAQLAASLGVNAADYSLNELVALHGASND